MSDQFGAQQDIYTPLDAPPATPPKKSNTTLIIVIVVLILLCCCCVVLAAAGYFFWTYGDQMLNIESQIIAPLLA